MSSMKLMGEAARNSSRQLAMASGAVRNDALFNIGENVITIAFTNQAAENIGGQTFHKAFKLNEEYYQTCISRLNEINPSHLKAIATKYLRNPLLSLVGPNSALIELERYWKSSNN